MLEGGEEGVEFGEGGALGGFEPFDGGDAPGEFALEGERGKRDGDIESEVRVGLNFGCAVGRK